MDCLFCNIIEGKVPSNKVYEDDNTLAFLDISPVNYGHTLVIPKKHYANYEEITEEDLTDLVLAVKKVGKAVKIGMEVEGYNASVNNDPVAGQIIPHMHFHIIPRREGDNLHLWPGGKYGDGEAEEIAESIKKRI